MKKSTLAALLAIAMAAPLAAQAAPQQNSTLRTSQLFNFGWKFHYGDTIANGDKFYANAFNDAAWRTIDLPHDFQFEQPWDTAGVRSFFGRAKAARGFKPMGTGWYRKAFTADKAWQGKRILLDFEGIMLVGDVWLNGVRIGGTDYGYVGFECDITKLVRYDGANVVAVRANTGDWGNSRWYTGGGLFRDVHLVVKNSVSIARHGVFITTPSITPASAQVQLQVEVEGLRGIKAHTTTISAKLYAPDGTLVGTAAGTVPTRSKSRTEEVMLSVASVAQPMLWDCEHPNLYSAEVTLTFNGDTVDRVREQFGIRTVEFSPAFGMKLNGKKVVLKGMANHHDLGAVGVAAYESAIERMMVTIKKFGFNHIRTSHNPYSESFLRMADKHGILLVDELYDKWSTQYAGGRKNWQLLWPYDVTEWVKRDRNHPSVVMWSLGNELQTQEAWIGYQTGDWGVTTYRILDAMLKRYDPTRKSTVAMFPARARAVGKDDPDHYIHILSPELALATDIASYNYRWRAFPYYKQQKPDLIFYQSEATTNDMGKPYWGMSLDSVVGLAYWGAIEYWGESQGWPWKGWRYSYFNHDAMPFPQAYYIKSMFSDEPTVRIAVADSERDTVEWNDVVVGRLPVSSHWNPRPGRSGAAMRSVTVVTYTNADEVELLVNGKSLGTQPNNRANPDLRNAIAWKNIPYAAGNITAIARRAGKEVARHRLETTGKAVALKIELERARWQANGLDLQYAHVYAVDKQGRVVPDAAGEVAFDVSGTAQLIAVDNGNHRSDELCTGTNRRRLHNGTALCILRAAQTPGTVNLTATVPGLKKATAVMKTE